MSKTELRLVELIRTLDTSERKYFKNFIAKENKPSLKSKVFDLYVKYEELGEGGVKEKAQKTMDEKSFAKIKQDLFHSICETMVFYHKNKPNIFEPYHLYQKINFLISKDLKPEAARIARELRHKMYHAPVQLLVPNLYSIELFVHMERGDIQSFFSVLEEHKQVKDLILGLNELHDTRMFLWANNLLGTAKMPAGKKGTAFFNQFSQDYPRVYNEGKAFISMSAELNFLTLLRTQTTDLLKKQEVAKKIFDLVYKHPDDFTIDALLYAYHVSIEIALEAGNNKTAKEFLIRLEKETTKTNAQKRIKYEIYYLLTLKMFSLSSGYAEIQKTIESFQASEKLLKIKFSDTVKAHFFSFKLWANLHTNNFNENKKIILKYATLKLKQDFTELYDVYRIFELLTSVELGDFDLLSYSLRNAKLAYKQNKALLELLAIIEKLSRQLLHEMKPGAVLIFTRIKKLQGQQIQQGKPHLLFKNFDLANWVKAKLRGVE